MVDIPISEVGCADVYIDDIITASLDIDRNNSRSSAAVPLAIHTLDRTLNDGEPIARSDLMCFRKLLAEGGLDEKKIVLGWKINTRK